MSEVLKVSHESPAVRIVDVETADAGSGLFVFRTVSRIHDIDENGHRVVASETVRQGVVDEENLDNLVSNREFKPFQPYEVPEEVGRLTTMLATPEAFEIMRRDGHLFDSRIYDRLIEGELLFTSSASNLPEVLADGMDAENIVFFASYDHSVVDYRGWPIPMAMRVNYLDGGVTNGRYDLEKVAEVLKENPEVEILVSGSRNSPISPIPSYNASNEADAQIQFLWRPSGESWERMLLALGFNPDHPSHLRIRPEDVIEAIDFFGIQQFRVEGRVDRDEFDGLGDGHAYHY